MPNPLFYSPEEFPSEAQVPEGTGPRSRAYHSQIQKYLNDEITQPELMLSGINQGVGAAEDWLNNALPNLGVSEWFSQTPMGQGLGGTLQRFQEDYPRTAESAGGLFKAANILGIGAGVGRLGTAVKNVPHLGSNYWPGFYSKNLAERAAAITKGFGEWGLNFVQTHFTPKGIELYDKGIPLPLLKRMEKTFSAARRLDDDLKQTISTIDSSDLPSAEKAKKITEATEKVGEEKRRLAKIAEGQLQHKYLTDAQLGQETPALFNDRYVNLQRGMFNQKEFSDMFPEFGGESERIYNALLRDQELKGKLGLTNPQDTIVIRRNAHGGAAGNLQQSVHTASDTYKGVAKAFVGQGFKKPFANYDKFRDVLEHSLTTKQQTALSSSGVEEQLIRAFGKRGSSLKKATNAEEFSAALKEHGINIHNKTIEKIMQHTPRNSFKDVDELTSALQKSGVKLSDAQIKAAKEKGSVLVSQGFNTEAVDLGGANVMMLIKPDGSLKVLVSDKYDLLNTRLPIVQKPLLNVSTFDENLLGGVAAKNSDVMALKQSDKTARPTNVTFTKKGEGGGAGQKATLEQLSRFEKINALGKETLPLGGIFQNRALANNLLAGNVFSKPFGLEDEE